MASSMESVTSSREHKFEWKTEPYFSQRKYWPEAGKHILAQFDEDTIVVYQAFRPSIAEFAVKNQRFGGDDYSFERMSWIKPNFLWMMYRCGWASKTNQEKILAICITKKGFDTILAKAYTAEVQKKEGLATNEIEVRLQWDPDHSPSYERLNRRAIQLGLKGKVLEKFATEWIVGISDITDFVKRQHVIFQKEGEESGNFHTASERVYRVEDVDVACKIGLDSVTETTFT